jgi:hypothetical protein
MDPTCHWQSLRDLNPHVVANSHRRNPRPLRSCLGICILCCYVGYDSSVVVGLDTANWDRTVANGQARIEKIARSPSPASWDRTAANGQTRIEKIAWSPSPSVERILTSLSRDFKINKTGLFFYDF